MERHFAPWLHDGAEKLKREFCGHERERERESQRGDTGKPHTAAMAAHGGGEEGGDHDRPRAEENEREITRCSHGREKKLYNAMVDSTEKRKKLHGAVTELRRFGGDAEG